MTTNTTMHDKYDTNAAWTRRLKPTLCLLAAAVTMTAGWLRASDEIPGAPQKKPIALVGGTVHTMTGEPLRDATVVFDRGKIVAVGQHVAIPAGAEKIDVHGKLVFPGLIDS